MNLEAIKHVPLSEDAYAIAEDTIVLRIRTKKDDIKHCVVYYGDRVCITNPITVKSLPMKLVGSDNLFDYYEVEIKSLFTRICYYFYLSNQSQSIYYIGGFFTHQVENDRTEYFQFPYLRREEIATVPEWAMNAVMYQIFPDSFATEKNKFVEEQKVKVMKEGISVSNHYGGTLSGISDNIEYLGQLGINCIYLNPIFTASSYHKYDTIDYFSVDPCLGDIKSLQELVLKCHKNGIRVLLDGVFNHCGSNFFAFQDVLKNGEQSKYKNWFYKLEFPILYDEMPNYEAFAYVKEMPKLNTSNPEVIDYLCRVGTYWIETADIDGWRLDVANEIDHEFWRSFRKEVKRVKPDAFLIGEIWEDSQIWLQGDQFDSTMNYRFSNICRRFFAEESISVIEFNDLLNTMIMRYKRSITYTQMNLLDSHDVPRFLTKCHGEVNRLRLAFLFMFTFIGIPSIFYGDEKGILGETELEYRRPMIWEENELSTQLVKEVSKMISLRKEYCALTYGTFQCILADDLENVYLYSREYLNQKVLIIINNGNKMIKTQLPIKENKKIIFSLEKDYLEHDMLILHGKSGAVIECS